MDLIPHSQERPSIYEAHKGVSIELNRAHFVHNVTFFKHLVQDQQTLCAVVKGDAYGHGVHLIVPELIALGVDTFAISKMEEAKWVRALAPNSRILLLCDPLRHCIKDVLTLHIEPCLNSVLDCQVFTQHFSAFISRNLRVHVKVDTGMSRLGLSVKEATHFFNQLPPLPSHYTMGLMSHYASSEQPESQTTLSQKELFQHMIQSIPASRVESHISNTCGTLNTTLRDQTQLVRIGIGLYGGLRDARLKPVLNWCTALQYIKTVKKGAGVGYVHLTHVNRDSRIGILPVGYRLGYPVALSQCGVTGICGYQAPILGRVGMDLMAIDLTDIPLQDEKLIDQTVTLFSDQPKSKAHVANLAHLAQTIPYELLCRLHPSIHRRWEDR